MLVEQAGVDVEDQVSHDVKPEVARLDHAGMDRADCDLVRVGTAHGGSESRESGLVVDERAEWLVAVEADPVEVVCLPLVPSRSGGDVDDRRHRAAGGVDALEAQIPRR